MGIRKIYVLEHAYSCLMDVLSTIKLAVPKHNHAWDKPSLPMNVTYEVYCLACKAYCLAYFGLRPRMDLSNILSCLEPSFHKYNKQTESPSSLER